MSRRTPHEQRMMDAIEEIVFIPTQAMRRVKAAYLASTQDNPLFSGEPTLAHVLQITNEPRMSQWWSVPGFRDWFRNGDEFRQRVEYLANKALDVVSEIMDQEDATPTARLNAAKLMIEAAGKLPRGGSGGEKFIDERIQEMNRKELEAFIRKAIPTVTPEGGGN